ncbi:MAG: hypothetical protein NTY12_05515 [Candidatus Falkowbacteria bacterium]|nr:hypothetical protein [Candidatus Falkowbacteria bacterium]
MLIKRTRIIISVLFILTVVFNYFYGASLYSTILGKEGQYTIGKLCVTSRTDCENTYFKEYLDKISSISNEKREYFSNIFIKENRANYTENCPCPYDTASNGSSCGGRSSYSKGGKISYCYDSDVSYDLVAQKKDSMIAEARKNLDNAVQRDINVYHEQYTLLFIIIVYGLLWLYFKNKHSKINKTNN